MPGTGATHVIIMGPQGAGKGTQAALIAPELNLIHISTGDLFREAMASDSAIGQEIRSYVDRGALVPDDLTIRMLMERVDSVLGANSELRGALFDGFPRNQAQAEALDEVLERRGDHLAGVVHVDVPRAVLMERLTGRLVCPNCGATFHRTLNPPRRDLTCDRCGAPLIQRSDDTPAAVEKRLSIYYAQTQPVLDYYRGSGLLIDVDGNQAIADVAEAILLMLQPRVEFTG
ncbi:MAG: adenylate kinase [Chloroflexi bacterium]|nr:adenylate kinase [Chloroflexota bacterium]